MFELPASLESKMWKNDDIKRIEQAMRKRLHLLLRHPMVRDTRGVGAVWTVELPNAELRDRLIDICEEIAITDDYGLKIFGDDEKSVCLIPPRTISRKDLRIALDLFLTALNKLRDEEESSYSIWI